MDLALRKDADRIIKESIAAVLPDEAVKKALRSYRPRGGKTVLVAAGKAAWQMANAAADVLGRVDKGIVITKYGHVMGSIPGVECFEAGHPVPDENGFAATRRALEMTADLTAEDTVIFLLSGGASALFELPKISGSELKDITTQLLAKGADITEINTVRKRLSNVKGGRFALACAPAKVFSVVLSDVPGDSPDMIASGPACPDSSTCEEAEAAAEKYALKMSPQARALLKEETPKELTNVETHVTGSVSELCRAAAAAAEKLGYEPVVLTDRLCCEAREAGASLADTLKSHAESSRSLAFIAGGETVVHVTGNGKGGRNQELALAAAPVIAGINGAAVFSVGSDGTDGPTDAAGGYVDYESCKALETLGNQVSDVLQNNDAYNALKAVDGLVFTGPTGTNVNDVAVALLRRN
ncbi:MAG: glycerate kinase [Clostridia bacterium]|nr:glycerate kinase [Clostridia bacterium]